jgi:hypothetical protein
MSATFCMLQDDKNEHSFPRRHTNCINSISSLHIIINSSVTLGFKLPLLLRTWGGVGGWLKFVVL